MKKKYILTGCAAIAFLNVSGQTAITLTKDNVPFVKRDVNVKVIKLTNFTVPTAGDTQVWDYSNLELLGDETFYFDNSTNSKFSSTAITEAVIEPITQDRAINIFNYIDKSDDGIMVPGFSADYQAYGIGDLTMNSKDTFYVPEQTQVFNDPQYSIKFPATQNSMWTNQSRRVIDFQLTVTSFGLNKTPGQKVTRTVRRDVVAGWGKMRLPVDSVKSMWYDVLMVNKGGNRTDSLYLNNEPAPAAMLTAFGINQGQITEEYSSYFYRANDFFPLMFINYGTDYTRTTPVFAIYTTDNLVATGIKETVKTVNPSVYPNPLNGNNLTISFYKNDNKDWKLNLVNVLGQIVQTENIHAAAGKLDTILNIDNVLTGGVYFVQIMDANGNLRGTSKVIINK
ncbi:MAG: T9SS type A sorting domain-containing protein [Bacteroidia bacterium]